MRKVAGGTPAVARCIGSQTSLKKRRARSEAGPGEAKRGTPAKGYRGRLAQRSISCANPLLLCPRPLRGVPAPTASDGLCTPLGPCWVGSRKRNKECCTQRREELRTGEAGQPGRDSILPADTWICALPRARLQSSPFPNAPPPYDSLNFTHAYWCRGVATRRPGLFVLGRRDITGGQNARVRHQDI